MFGEDLVLVLQLLNGIFHVIHFDSFLVPSVLRCDPVL